MVIEKENPPRSPPIHQIASEWEKRFLQTPLRIVSGLYRLSVGEHCSYKLLQANRALTTTNSKLLERHSCAHVENRPRVQVIIHETKHWQVNCYHKDRYPGNAKARKVRNNLSFRLATLNMYKKGKTFRNVVLHILIRLLNTVLQNKKNFKYTRRSYMPWRWVEY